MNITHAREVQKSILDESLPFDMADWCHCIAGHAYRCRVGEVARELTPCLDSIAMEYLDLHSYIADRLFGQYRYTRIQAVAALQYLIEQEERVTRDRAGFLAGPGFLVGPASLTARPHSEAVEAVEAVLEPELVCV